MKIKLSKILIVFCILINHFSFAQTDTSLDNFLTMVEDIKNGSNSMNNLCDPNSGLANGPWYQAFWITDSGRRMSELYMLGNPNEGDPISSQRRGNLSLIDKDGVVLFCEGESRFSGLVTAENVAFIGNGEPENIIVSPAENFYFNLVSLHSDNLQLFANHYNLDDVENANHYNLDDVEKMIDRQDNDSRILIDNVTFTNHNSRIKSQLWLDNPDEQQFDPEECLGALDDYMNDRGLTFSGRLNSYCDRFGISTFSGGAVIELDRPRTFLHINNVIFKEFANVARIIESIQKGGDTKIENTQIIDTQTIDGTIRALITENLSLSNINIINNFRATLDLFTSTDHSENNLSLSNIKILNNAELDFILASLDNSGKNSFVNIELENIEVANNNDLLFLSVSKEVTWENILFRNNVFREIYVATPEKGYSNINNFNLINNRGSTFYFNGSGRITESRIEKNTSGVLIFASEALTVDNLFVNGNEKTRIGPVLVTIGNIVFNNTVFTDNYTTLNPLNTTVSESTPLSSVIEPRGMGAPALFALGRAWFSNTENIELSYENLSKHRLEFYNVKYYNRNMGVNTPFILAYNGVEVGGEYATAQGRFHAMQRQMGRQITLENYQELLRLPVNEGVSIYQFNEIDKLECSFENDIYECSR